MCSFHVVSVTSVNIVLYMDIITIYNPISFNINNELFENTLENSLDVMWNMENLKISSACLMIKI